MTTEPTTEEKARAAMQKASGRAQEPAESRAVVQWEDSGVPIETVGMARALHASGLFPAVRNVATAIVKIQMGASLGVTPVEAMQYVHIFASSGDRVNIQLGYPLIGAMIQRSGKYHTHVRIQEDDVCEIDFYRIGAGGEMRLLGTSKFTMEQAKRAGLAGKQVWKEYPEIMLYARALSHGARTFCPEVLGGASVYTDEPYIEGSSRVIEPDVIEDAPPRVIEEPPEGMPDPWVNFWPDAKKWGFTKDQVHAFFGVGPEKGALKAYAEAAAGVSGVSLGEIIGQMYAKLEREANRRADLAAEDEDRRQQAAALDPEDARFE